MFKVHHLLIQHIQAHASKSSRNLCIKLMYTDLRVRVTNASRITFILYKNLYDR
jgi:hypothetical protein